MQKDAVSWYHHLKLKLKRAAGIAARGVGDGVQGCRRLHRLHRLHMLRLRMLEEGKVSAEEVLSALLLSSSRHLLILSGFNWSLAIELPSHARLLLTTWRH